MKQGLKTALIQEKSLLLLAREKILLELHRLEAGRPSRIYYRYLIDWKQERLAKF